MITRDITDELLRSAAEYPVVILLGPHQSGKTTLARRAFPEKPYFSLEDPDIRMAAETDPRGFLAMMKDGGILDEVQRVPALLSYIQGIVDKTRRRGMFILTGSHQPQLHEAISQSLAGRTAMLALWPFSLHELRSYESAWNRGIRPEIYFFRDSHGNEIDLPIREKGALIPVEIKSAATFSPDFVGRVEWFQTLGGARVTVGAVLYNGEQSFNIRNVRVFNPLQGEDIWEKLTEPS